MRFRIIIFLMVLFLLFIAESCDETFSPYGKFETKYSLNCIIRADTNVQIATVFQSYPLNNNSSSQYRNTSFIHGAFIRLWSGNDDIFILKDTTENIDTLHHSTPISFYYTHNFVTRTNENLQIDVLLPDGNRLKSKTKVPAVVKKNSERTTVSIPPENGDMVTFAWQTSETAQIFIPILRLFYQTNGKWGRITKNIQIPWRYVIENGKEIGINKPPSKMQSVKYSMENIERSLKLISKGDNNKKNYFILSAVLELKILDKNLSAYYLSTGRLFDNYSIRLDIPDFSNIQGGFGIFGSFRKQNLAILFDDKYLSRFGYRNGF